MQNPRRKHWWSDLAEYKVPKRQKDDMKYIMVLMRMMYKKQRKVLQASGRGRGAYHAAPKKSLPPSYGRLQNCIVKMSYGNDRKSSLDFIEKYMKQLAKKEVIDKPKLFSDIPVTDKTLGDVRKAVVSAKSERFYRFVISPEKNGVDLELMTKALVKKMEWEMGRKVRWLAAVHRDTDHNHVHLWIHGTDMAGKEIEKIPKEMVTNDIRRYAQEFLTSQLGYRSKAEVELQKSGLYKVCRFTKLDRDLAWKQHKLPALHGEKWGYVVVADSFRDRKRLETLKDLDLAMRHEKYPDGWYLEADWINKLMAANNNNVFFKARKGLKFTNRWNLSLYADDKPVLGIVTRIFNPDWEDTWKGAYVIENSVLGKAWFVPVPSNRPPKMELLGKAVTAEMKVNRNGFKYPVVAEMKAKSKTIARASERTSHFQSCL